MIVRPRLAPVAASLPSSLYFVGFVGGLLTLGAVGVVLGPVAVAPIVETGRLLGEDVSLEQLTFDDVENRGDGQRRDRDGSEASRSGDGGGTRRRRGQRRRGSIAVTAAGEGDDGDGGGEDRWRGTGGGRRHRRRDQPDSTGASAAVHSVRLPS
jgi:hypothetical protein